MSVKLAHVDGHASLFELDHELADVDVHLRQKLRMRVDARALQRVDCGAIHVERPEERTALLAGSSSEPAKEDREEFIVRCNHADGHVSVLPTVQGFNEFGY